jgi:hypothetical protein
LVLLSCAPGGFLTGGPGGDDPFGATGHIPPEEVPPGGDSVSIAGLVQDMDDLPLSGVRVLLRTLAGSERYTAVSDSAGNFSFRSVAPGSYRLEASYPPDADTAPPPPVVPPGADPPPPPPDFEGRVEVRGLPPVRLFLALDPSDPARGDVRVEARRDPLEVVGFHERRARESGSFLTLEEIQRREAATVSELVSALPGFRFSPVGGGYALVGRQGCLPNLFLDGTDVGDTRSLDFVTPVSHLAAVEAYPGRTPPAEFAGFGSECGAVVLWTRRGAR